MSRELPFLFEETTPVMYLPEEVFNDMETSLEVLLKEYEGHSPYKKRIVGSIMVFLCSDDTGWINA